MAPRFQNGLHINAGISHALAKYIIEFATQVLGWTYRDNDDAGFAATTAAAADLATHASDPAILDFNGAAYVLTGSEVGWIVTVLGNVGWSAAEKQMIGMYEIISVDTTAKTARVDIKRGVHEDGLPLSKGSVTYRLWDPTTDIPGNSANAVLRTQYLHAPNDDFDVQIQTDASGIDHPFVSIGPFGTWVIASGWSDSRNTTLKQPHGAQERNYRIWAFGDETDNDHFFIGIQGIERNEFNWYYVGAITPTAGTVIDTHPGVIAAGMAGDQTQVLGPGSPVDAYSSWRWMAYNGGSNDVTATGVWMAPVEISDDASHLFMLNQKWSQWSHGIYRFEIMLHSITASHREARGVPKSIRYGGKIQNLTPFGPGPTPATNYFLHLGGGLSIPWNGSKVHVQWDD